MRLCVASVVQLEVRRKLEYTSIRDLWPSLLTAFLTGAASLLAGEWAFRLIFRKFQAGGLGGTLVLSLLAAFVFCVVAGVFLVGGPALLGTWPLRGSERIYGLALLVGFAAGRLAFHGRRRSV